MNEKILYISWNPNALETTIKFNKLSIIISDEIIFDEKIIEIHSTSGIKIKFHPKG